MKARTIIYTLLAALAIQFPSVADAQVKHTNSIYGGYGYIKFANLKDKTDYRYDYPYNGFFVGWRHNIKPRKEIELYVNTGVEFDCYFNSDSYDSDLETYYGVYRDDKDPTYVVPEKLEKYEDNYSRHMNFLGLKFPLDISYNFKVNGTKLAFRPFFGIHAGVLLYGHSHEEYYLIFKYYDLSEKNDEYMEYDKEHIIDSANLLEDSEEDYNQEALKRIYAGWHVGINVAYDRYSIGVTLENDMLHMSNYYSNKTITANFAYTF